MNSLSTSIVLLVIGLAFVCNSNAAAVKFAYIYDGPVGDAGYTFSHNQALIQLERSNRGNITTAFYPSVDYGQDAITLIDDLVSKNFSIIAFSSEGFLESVQIAARKYGSTFFIICDDGQPTEPNIGVVATRVYEGQYLAGIIAGTHSKTGDFGIVGFGMDTWTSQNINAFTIGATSMNPNTQVFVNYIDSWYNETNEYDVAKSMIENHEVDLITQHTDSFQPMLAAKELQTYCIGWAVDMQPLVGPQVLTSVLLNWKVGLQHQLDLYFQGNYNDTTANRINWGIKEGLIALAPFSSAVNQTTPGFQFFKSELERFQNGNSSIFCGSYARELVNATDLVGDCLDQNQIDNMLGTLSNVYDVTNEVIDQPMADDEMQAASEGHHTSHFQFCFVVVFFSICTYFL